MFRNFLKTAFKQLYKNRIFTLINLSGFAVAITGLFLVYIYVQHQQLYDTFFPDHKRIFRVCQNEISEEGYSLSDATAPPLAAELASTVPEIESACRFLQLSSRLVTGGEYSAYQDQVVYVDPSFLSIFSIKFLQGDPVEALLRPDEIVITREIAESYFGSVEAVDKTLSFRGTDFNVCAVIENPPSYSHLQYDILCTINRIEDEEFHKRAWLWHAIWTYVKLKENVDPDVVNEKIKYLKNESAIETFKNAGLDYTFFLQNVSSINKEVLTDDGIVTSSAARNVVIFQMLGIFVLFLACLNYINLSLALYFRRAREVGVRKVNGASRKQLVLQFLVESSLNLISAGLLSMVLIETIMPHFLTFTGIPADFLKQVSFLKIAIFITAMFLVGIISGLYPALHAAAHNVNYSLKQTKSRVSGSLVRPLLIIVQFSIAVIIIVLMLSMKKQIMYMQNRELGFDASRKLVLTLKRETEFGEKYESIKQIFTAIPGVARASGSNAYPGTEFNSYYIECDEAEKGLIQSTMYCFSIDEDFVPSYGLEIIYGRNFDPLLGDPQKEFLMTEAGFKHMGWETAQEAIGKIISSGNRGRTGEIIGVIRDFNYTSLQYKINPLFLEYFPPHYTYLSLEINSGDIAGTIKTIQQKWRELFPNIPFESTFAEDKFNALYLAEIKAVELMNYFSVIAIMIACSGLVGISLFMIQLRIKEIGIRKVLGASIKDLLLLLNSSFLKWIIIANIIASPIAYLILQKWLQNFAFRMPHTVELYFLTGLITLGLAIVTLSYQTFRAATLNPVETLKYE